MIRGTVQFDRLFFILLNKTVRGEYAKEILAYVLTLPDNWNFHINELS